MQREGKNPDDGCWNTMFIFALSFTSPHKDLTDLSRYYKYVNYPAVQIPLILLNSSLLKAEPTPPSLTFHARLQKETNVECC